MKNGRMQCKDIPDAPILAFLAEIGRWATWFPGFENSVQNAMPAGVPDKLALAKMGALIRRGLVDGCACGCRGDFRLPGPPAEPEPPRDVRMTLAVAAAVAAWK